MASKEPVCMPNKSTSPSTPRRLERVDRALSILLERQGPKAARRKSRSPIDPARGKAAPARSCSISHMALERGDMCSSTRGHAPYPYPRCCAGGFVRSESGRCAVSFSQDRCRRRLRGKRPVNHFRSHFDVSAENVRHRLGPPSEHPKRPRPTAPPNPVFQCEAYVPRPATRAISM